MRAITSTIAIVTDLAIMSYGTTSLHYECCIVSIYLIGGSYTRAGYGLGRRCSIRTTCSICISHTSTGNRQQAGGKNQAPCTTAGFSFTGKLRGNGPAS